MSDLVLICKTCNEVIVRKDGARGVKPQFCNAKCRRVHPEAKARKQIERSNYREIQNKRRGVRRLDADYRRAEMNKNIQYYQAKIGTPEGAALVAVKQRANKLQIKFGMTLQDYDEMLIAQNGCCACCGGTRSPFIGGDKLAVDHVHGTRLVRGLLCNTCNSGIGKLGDTLEGVRKAVLYLERFEQKLARLNRPVSPMGYPKWA